ncbi:MAG: VTT domain-containing protein [Chloroflexota bacterium]
MASEAPEEKKQGWLRQNLVPLLTLLLIIAISLTIFFLSRRYSKRLEALKNLGYLGAFLLSLLFNASVILPAGNIFVVAALGALMPLPLLVGLAAGSGAALGELSGYLAGASGRQLLAKNRGNLYLRVEGWVRKWGSPIIFVFSAAPFFFDLAGIAAGALRFPLRKFLIACWLGRTLLYIVAAYAGARGWEALLKLLG